MTKIWSRELALRLIVAGIGVPIIVWGLLTLSWFPLFFILLVGSGVILEWSLLFWQNKNNLSWRSRTNYLFFTSILLYIILSFVPLSFLPPATAGQVLLMCLITVWLTDTGGYICGKLLGGPKLASQISPNKTWSGAVGGVAFVFLAIPLIQKLCPILESKNLVLCLGFLSAMGQIGDLVESWAKRRLNVKQSGALLPGHGGIFDRFDSLIGALYGYFLWTFFS